MEIAFLVVFAVIAILFATMYFIELKSHLEIIRLLLHDELDNVPTVPVNMSDSEIKEFKAADKDNTSEFMSAIAGLNEFMTGYKEANNVEEQ